MDSSQPVESRRGFGKGRGGLIAIGSLAGVLLCASDSLGARTVEEELLRNAPLVFDYLKGHGFKTVGVLKFRVQNGQARISDREGPLNLNLTTRLELALALTTDIADPINIIRDASATAERLPGANHLVAEGRRALFAGRYRLAWGDDQGGAEADAFLTGVVEVRDDLRELTVAIMGFGRESAGLDPVAKFTATTDPPALVDLGASFQSRGVVEGGRLGQPREQVIASATRIREGVEVHPLLDPEAPVALEVVYGDTPAPLEVRAGKAFVAEPHEGQTVTLILRKRDKSRTRYGVVLEVDGKNTLFKERASPLASRKWILSRETPEIRVRGYQSKEFKAEAFHILSAKESQDRLMSYGPDAGRIHLVVFREEGPREKPAKPPVPKDPPLAERAPEGDPEDLAVLHHAAWPALPPANIHIMRAQLPALARDPRVRGLIQEGTAFASPIRRVEFKPDPIAVLSATITYYAPR